MTKKKQPIEYQDPDPLDGTKMIGCLMIGVVILLAIGYFSITLISNLRTP